MHSRNYRGTMGGTAILKKFHFYHLLHKACSLSACSLLENCCQGHLAHPRIFQLNLNLVLYACFLEIRLKVYPTNYNMDLLHNVVTCYNNIQHFHMYFLSLSLLTGLFYIALSPSNECFMLQYIYQILFVRKNFLKPKITGIQTMTAVFRDANHLCCFAQIPIKYLCWRSLVLLNTSIWQQSYIPPTRMQY